MRLKIAAIVLAARGVPAAVRRSAVVSRAAERIPRKSTLQEETSGAFAGRRRAVRVRRGQVASRNQRPSAQTEYRQPAFQGLVGWHEVRSTRWPSISDRRYP